MARIVIVDGPEGSGKSTLVREFQRAWPGPSYAIHFSKRGSNDPHILYGMLDAAYVLPPSHLVVFDRSWLSDMVYRALDGRKLAWRPKLVQIVEQYAIDHGCVLICLPNSFYPAEQVSKVGVSIVQEQYIYAQKVSPAWLLYQQPPDPARFLEEVFGVRFNN